MNESPAVLERCVRALLLAYPAQYRRERGEEIVGTLLEAAPPGRRFPSAPGTPGRGSQAGGMPAPPGTAGLGPAPTSAWCCCWVSRST
jgi:hypothetical protein